MSLRFQAITAAGSRAGLTFKGPVANPAAKLDLKMDQGLLAGRQVDRLRLLLNLEDRLATISDTALDLAGGTIGLDGTVNLKGAFPSDLFTPTGRPEYPGVYPRSGFRYSGGNAVGRATGRIQWCP